MGVGPPRPTSASAPDILATRFHNSEHATRPQQRLAAAEQILAAAPAEGEVPRPMLAGEVRHVLHLQAA